jgi:mannose/fructose-specific phosphotransferase system component IIA
MENYATFILTHEKIAVCLKRATENILGEQKNIFPYTNLTDAIPVLVKKINDNIKNVKPDRIICFVDLAGGSCWSLANMIRKQHPMMTIIAGVNMPMLLSFFNNLNELPYKELIKKVIKDGSRGIMHVKGTS